MSRGDTALEQTEPLRSAFNALHKVTGLSASLLSKHSPEQDGRMILRAPDGRDIEFVYETKSHVDRRDQLWTFKHQNGNAVLITRLLSSAMIEHCRQLHIQFIDSSGNCFLSQPGLFIFVSGRKETTTAQGAITRGLTPAVLQLMFAVLSKPSIFASTVRHIAGIAGISHGAAGTGLVMLEEIGLAGKSASGKRMLLQPGRWLDIWTEGYLGRLRPKLATHRMSSSVSILATLDRISPAMNEIMLGGEAAAAYEKLGLKPGALTIYIDMQQPNVIQDLARELKLRRDQDGGIEFVEIFWNTREISSFPTVPDALIYADLLGSGDERNLDVAGELKKRIVSDVASKA